MGQPLNLECPNNAQSVVKVLPLRASARGGFFVWLDGACVAVRHPLAQMCALLAANYHCFFAREAKLVTG
jgi:hypothetical protein